MSTSEYFLIAEDHTLVNMGYRILLEDNFPKSRQKFVQSRKELEAVLNEHGHEFTFALWDLQLTDGNVLTLISNTLKRFEGLYMLIVTSSSEEVFAEQLYKAGVRGYLTKNAREEEILLAINTILSGNIYFSKAYRRLATAGHHRPQQVQDNPFSALSIRELDILKHLLTGQRIKEISTVTGLKQSTIATYKQRLLEKLHAKSIVELHQLATLHNLFDSI